MESKLLSGLERNAVDMNLRLKKAILEEHENEKSTGKKLQKTAKHRPVQAS